MPEGGKLTITAKTDTFSRESGRPALSTVEGAGQGVILAITDTGVGIPPENMAKLFEPLFTTKARGIGLGLAVSRRLVEANDGSIEVESEEGMGSAFSVVLPAREVIL
jgi:signal transduction histidine kinase